MKRSLLFCAVLLSLCFSAQGQSVAVQYEKADSGYRWIDRITNIPQYMRDFHTEYGRLVQEVLNGGTNCLSDPSLGVEIYMPESGLTSYNVLVGLVEDTLGFTFPAGSVDRNIAVYAYNAVMNYMYYESLPFAEASQFVDYLALAINYDYPEAFWQSADYRFFYQWPYEYNANKMTGQGNIYIHFKVFMCLCDDNTDSRFLDFQDAEGMTNGVNVFNNSIEAIMQNCPDADRCGKIAYFNDWLTKHNSYCSADDMVFAPDLIRSSYTGLKGCTGESGPVCEGYARAFKVLCDRAGIPCVVVTGQARRDRSSSSEVHMWNEVQLENGLWYAVDVTWNDPVVKSNPDAAVSGGETEFWLLKGKNDVVAQSFRFSESHPNSLTWSSFNAIFWIYSVKTYITANGYDRSSSVVLDKADGIQEMKAYGLDGRYIGNFSSMDALRREIGTPGIVIVNGKKVILR